MSFKQLLVLERNLSKVEMTCPCSIYLAHLTTVGAVLLTSEYCVYTCMYFNLHGGISENQSCSNVFLFFLMWTFAKCKASIQIKDHTTVLELKGHFNVTSRFGFELVRDLIRPLIAWKQALSELSCHCPPGQKKAFNILEDPMFYFWM